MDNTVFSAEQMILIGGTGRNRGKTVLAEELIRRFKDRFSVVGLKVTTVAHAGGVCPRGGEGCGACAISENYVLTEEPEDGAVLPAGCSGKDTARLLHAGAERVFWLRSLRSALEEGYAAVLEKIPPKALIIGESNSLREVVKPGCFIMVSSGPEEQVKPSAARVADLAQIRVKSPITADAVQKLMAELIVENRLDGKTQVRLVDKER
jgi:molybdopterin-guanine dinucleotide biosynthesis protein